MTLIRRWQVNEDHRIGVHDHNGGGGTGRPPVFRIRYPFGLHSGPLEMRSMRDQSLLETGINDFIP